MSRREERHVPAPAVLQLPDCGVQDVDSVVAEAVRDAHLHDAEPRQPGLAQFAQLPGG